MSIFKKESNLPENPNLSVNYNGADLKEIWLAGGCFWGLQAYMDRIYGVAETSVGYANGKTQNPSYEKVCHENTGHAETVYVKYDPSKLELKNLLKDFFRVVNPTQLNQQGNDVGSQYRSGIYYMDEKELNTIKEVVKCEEKNYSKPIVTEVLQLTNYSKAEEYHQKYLEKNPNGYCHINLSTVNEANQIKVDPTM